MSVLGVLWSKVGNSNKTNEWFSYDNETVSKELNVTTIVTIQTSASTQSQLQLN